MAARLSRERILEVADRLAREDGLEALSMRRIAEQLDVWPMSLYRHFQDKDALLDALAAGAAPARRVAVRGRGWRAQVAGLAAEVRAVVAAQPSGMGERLALVLDGPAVRELDGAAVGARERGGGGGVAEAATAWGAVTTYAFGAAVRRLDDDAFAAGLALLLDGLAVE
jgi:AcrR family transcriptional regulator